jgi:type I restriction enzyme S subunit
MPLTRFADGITLASTRTPDPLAAGIERFVGLEHIEPENLHIRSWGLVADGTTFTNTFKRGQVLFGKRRAYQRKVAVAEFDGVCSSDIYVFESKDPNVLLPELVPFILQSEGFYQYAVKTSAGSLSPRTNWTHLANYEFPLPPVDEQRRIADLLWAADDAITTTEELHRKSIVALSALIDEAVKAGSVGDTNREKLKPTDIGLIPNSWSVSTLLDFADKGRHSFVNGPFGSDLLTSELQKTGVPVIYVRDIKPNRYIRVSTVHVSEAKSVQLAFCQVDYGDVLIAKVGDPPGFAAPYFEKQKSIVTQDVVRIRPARDVNSVYLACLLNSSIGKQAIQNIKISGTRERFPLTQFKKIKLPKPPIDEQNRIAAIFSQFISGIETIETHLEKTKVLKKEILAKFLG